VQQNGEPLLRSKGILSLAGEARRWVFHGVHMTLEGRPGRPWAANEHRTSAIVFIGRGLDATRIRNEIADLTLSDASLVTRSIPKEAAQR
jgi:G3E family GTPase